MKFTLLIIYYVSINLLLVLSIGAAVTIAIPFPLLSERYIQVVGGIPYYISFGNYIVAIIFTLVLHLAIWFFIAVFLVYLRHRIVQAKLNLDVSQLVESLDKGNDPIFFLYLRPFSTTGKVSLEQPISQTVITDMNIAMTPFRAYNADFEFFLRKSLSGRGVVLGLGKPGEKIGVGRLEASEENWRETVVRLSERAKAIFVVPGKEEGTIWEILHIVSTPGLLEKSVFLLPRRQGKNTISSKGSYSEFRARLLDVNVSFPDFLGEGRAFTVKAEKDGMLEVKDSVLIGTSRSSDIKYALELVYDYIPFLELWVGRIVNVALVLFLLIVLRTCFF